MKVNEAATLKSRAQGLLRAAQALLADKELPKGVRASIETLRTALKKSWADLEGEAGEVEEPKESARWIPISERSPQPDEDVRGVWSPIYGGWLKEVRYQLGEFVGPDGAEITKDVTHWMLDDTPMPPQGEAANMPIESACIPLVEESVRADGTIPIKIIQPGWGSSGFYPADVLERDGPKVFTPGVKMYWNHPSASEETERPERDLRDLAGEFTSAARWEASGPAGAGLYADAKVFTPYQAAVNELAPHIGVSIRAIGRAKSGEAEGKSGAIVEELVAARSVDFVTQPGAGGQILQVFEAARRGAIPRPAAHSMAAKPQEASMTEAEIKNLQDRNAALEQDNARLKEALTLREAGDFVADLLAKEELPEPTRARLLAQLVRTPTLTEGALDREAYQALVETTVKAERDYLAAILPTGGQIRGMGGAPRQEDGKKKLAEAFERTGLSADAAKIAAEGR